MIPLYIYIRSFLKRRGLKFKLLKFTFHMMKISYASCFGLSELSPAISAQYTLEMYAKTRKLCILRVQDCSRSLALIPAASPSLVFVMVNSKFVLTCNGFYTSGKITCFRGACLLRRPCSKKNPFTCSGMKIYHKTRVLVAAHVENFMILTRIVLIVQQGVTDRQTDASTIAKTRERRAKHITYCRA